MPKKLLFLTLNTFSATGGIEKVCRVAGKALCELGLENKTDINIFSLYDRTEDVDQRYIPVSQFRGFAGQRVRFVREAVQAGRKADVVILSHINLLLPGYFIKLFSPRTKLVLIAHGIEVWDELGRWKQKMLKAVDVFLPVSHFTGKRLKELHGILPEKIKVINNCIDPFLRNNVTPDQLEILRKRYGFNDNDFVLLTLTRIKYSEQYKGYDKVVKALASFRETGTKFKYLIAGKYDEDEKARLDQIIAKYGMTENVVFAGFISDDLIASHFNLADVYIMPSTGEGFGIVFIEALFYGKPVIAGNLDGSVDALANGAFGILVNPEENEEIVNAIKQVGDNIENFRPSEKDVKNKFGFERYKLNWEECIFRGSAISSANGLIRNRN